MGAYDCFGNCQLKVGLCELIEYKIGDVVPIQDGVYLDYGGVVVIKDHKFIAEFSELRDKWGGHIEPREIIDPINPVSRALERFKEPE
jgi:hypothetical protein